MTYDEALGWLDENGGEWIVRATRVTCMVVATLGPAKVEAPMQTLRGLDVEHALASAVAELHRRISDGTPA